MLYFVFVDERLPMQQVPKSQRVHLPFFSKAIRSGGHQKSIDAVLSGAADCAAIDCVVLDRLLHEGVVPVDALRRIEDGVQLGVYVDRSIMNTSAFEH